MVQAYRLMIGQHIGPDFKQDVDEKTGKRPSKTYNAPCKVYSETDLVAKHGVKFAYLPGTAPKKVSKTPAPAPEVDEESEEDDLPEVDAALAEDSDDEGDEGEAAPEVVTMTTEELNAMSIKELKAYASERGIDVAKAGNNKTKLVNLIESAAPTE